jgi:hypothetical protein
VSGGDPYRLVKPRTAPASVDGSTLVVVPDGILPKICLKCGAEKKLRTRVELFEYAPPGLYLSFMLSPIAFLVLAWLTRRTARATISLCRSCDDRWRDAKTAQNLTVPASLAATVAIATAVFNDAYVIGAVLAVLSALTIIWVRRRFVRGRTLDVRWIGPRGIELDGVASSAAKAAVEKLAPLDDDQG